MTSCHWIAICSVAGIDVYRRALIAVTFVAVVTGALVLAVVVWTISAVGVDVAIVLTSGTFVDFVRLASVAIAIVAVIASARIASHGVDA